MNYMSLIETAIRKKIKRWGKDDQVYFFGLRGLKFARRGKKSSDESDSEEFSRLALRRIALGVKVGGPMVTELFFPFGFLGVELDNAEFVGDQAWRRKRALRTQPIKSPGSIPGNRDDISYLIRGNCLVIRNFRIQNSRRSAPNFVCRLIIRCLKR